MARPSNNPRAVALALLQQVLNKRRALDQALEQDRSWAALAPRDRAFARLLVATMLRRLGQLDGLIDHCLQQPLKRRETDLRDLLRLGMAQLLFLGTPPHAAVSTTLTLAESHPRLAGRKGLLNAVLRRLAREGAALAAAQEAGRINTPDWLWASWSAAHGEAAAGAIAKAHLSEAPLDISVKGGAADLTHWAERLGAAPLYGRSLRIAAPKGEVTRMPGFAEGAWWVQDLAAALVPRLLGLVEGRRVIDLCAAPGGKTLALAAGGAEVTAVDRSPARLKRLKDNLARTGLAAEVVAADAAGWRPGAAPDAVLLDAPCSATGTLRRHPDIAHLRSPADVAKLAALQSKLLDNAVAMLPPGGRLIYAVCSLQPEEGREQIDRLLSGGAPVERQPVTASDLEAESLEGLDEVITPVGDLQSLPCHLAARGGLDGFYACRLRRL